MGSLKILGSRRIEGGLLIVAALCIALPFTNFLVRHLLSFDLEAWNAVFFLTLLRALGFSALQAFSSALISCTFAIIAATWILTLKPRASLWAQRAFEGLGLFIFVLPGTALALATLDLFRYLPFLDSLGGPISIVWAHVSWSTGLLTAILCRRLRAYFSSGDSEAFEAAVLFGARGHALSIDVLWPALKSEISVWFRLIFFWSFGAFSTLLILGNGPQHASAEVLLFYSLLNEGGSSRILLLSIVQAFIAWKLTGFAAPPAVFEQTQSSRKVSPSLRDSLYGRPGSRFFAGTLSLLLLLMIAWVLAGAPLSLIACTSSSACVTRLTDLPWLALSWNSFFLASSVAILCALATVAFVLATERARSVWRLFFCITPTLLGALWLQLPVEEWLRGRPLGQLAFAALALMLAQMPFLAFWVQGRLASLREDLLESAVVLGAPLSSLPWAIKLPLCRDLIARAALISGCFALGELAITSLFVRDADLLATQARLLASRYDFAGGALALLLTSVLAGVLMILISPWSRKNQRT